MTTASLGERSVRVRPRRSTTTLALVGGRPTHGSPFSQPHLGRTPLSPREVRSGAPRLSTPGVRRLTRRGRLVLGGLLVLICLVVFSLGRFSVGANAAGSPLRVTVVPGDTLWSIAHRADPRADPRAEVARIVSTNHLSGSYLSAGVVLVVPRA